MSVRRVPEAPIIHVVPYFPPHLGGMEKVASTLAEELAKIRRVEVLTTDCGAKGVPRKEYNGSLTICRSRALEIANVPVAPGIFLRCLKASPQSIVHVHVAQALVPEMVWMARRLRGGKFVAHFHLDVASSGRFGRVFGWYKRRVLGNTLRAAERIITFSADQANFLERTYRIDARRIVIIPNGVGPEFSPTSEFDGAQGRPIRILYVGRLSQQKALPRLVHALAAMTQPTEVHLVGEGDERPVIEDMIRRYGLKHVQLLGRRQGDELVAAYRWADVFVLPSDREGMPLVVLEAMATGLPVVATDVVGNRELVKGVGMLVDPDAMALAAALDRIAEDDVLRMELAKQSLEAAENYTVERLVERLNGLYSEIAE